MPSDEQPRPICFVVMPFRKKAVGRTKRPAPAEVDFDALWERAFRPAIVKLGYEAARADFDPGSVIIADMLERLAFADLVLADVSVPNGNVYYEIGLRHVAKKTSCVLVAADWSEQLFDIDQFTTLRYALADGTVLEEEADKIAELLVESVPQLKDTITPYHRFITEGLNETSRIGPFREHARRLSDFQARVQAARLYPRGQRKVLVQNLLAELPSSSLEIAEVATELMVLLRDEVGWTEMLAFVERLPRAVAALPVIVEQRLLALAETGKPEEAIAQLEQLIAQFGATPERYGIMGGRYKRLFQAAKKERTESGKLERSLRESTLLDRAIDSYTKGMELDYNEYYCSSNLPNLLNERDRPGNAKRGLPSDRDRAQLVEHLVKAACHRMLRLGKGDEYLRPTLLGIAFRTQDVDAAEELAELIATEGTAVWKLESTLSDLNRTIDQAPESEVKAELTRISSRLVQLVNEAKS